MRFTIGQKLLAFSISLVLFQFATPVRGYASELAKTVEQADPVAQEPPKGMLPAALLSLQSDAQRFSHYAFLVDKRARTLTVWQADGKLLKLIGAWPTDIGRRQGDKLVEGDKRTPEGVYFFQHTMDGHKVDFSLYGARIFTLDYPNYFDRLEKKTGNGIWLHAIPDTKSLTRGSHGCVVVRNKVIQELAKYVELKYTPIVIVDHVDYLTPDQWLARQKKFMTWLDGWRAAWSGKDLNQYMSWYSDEFHSSGMNIQQWRSYKKRLNRQYKYISVSLSDVQIFDEGPKVVYRFLQSYKSNRKTDLGDKILYALKDPKQNRYEIIGEKWKPDKVENDLAKAAASESASTSASAASSSSAANSP